MERETGFEPATSSLRNRPFERIEGPVPATFQDDPQVRRQPCFHQYRQAGIETGICVGRRFGDRRAGPRRRTTLWNATRR